MKELLATKSPVLRDGSRGEKQIVPAIRLPGLTMVEKVLVALIFVALTTLCVIASLTSRQPLVGPILWLLIMQPLLLGVYARKRHDRVGTMWGLLTLGMNIGVIAFFETHLPSRWGEDFVQLSIAELMSTIIVVTALALLSKHESIRERNFATNLRSGLFRFWVVASSLWLIVCAMQFYLHCSRYDCRFFVGMRQSSVNYLDIAESFVGIPALAFVLGLATCWAIDGFRIRVRTGSTEHPTGR